MTRGHLGQIGEQMAVRYLENNNYRILARNWMAGHGVHCVGEIDIVAQKGDEIHFVEVKCRSNDGGTPDFSPEGAITPMKLEKIERSVEQYLLENCSSNKVFIDLVSINFPPNGHPSIRHYIGIV